MFPPIFGYITAAVVVVVLVYRLFLATRGVFGLPTTKTLLVFVTVASFFGLLYWTVQTSILQAVVLFFALLVILGTMIQDPKKS